MWADLLWQHSFSAEILTPFGANLLWQYSSGFQPEHWYLSSLATINISIERFSSPGQISFGNINCAPKETLFFQHFDTNKLSSLGQISFGKILSAIPLSDSFLDKRSSSAGYCSFLFACLLFPAFKQIDFCHFLSFSL